METANEQTSEVQPPTPVSPEYASGVTWRSLLALIYGVVILQPAIIFLYAVAGGEIYLGLAWILVLLWVEVSSLFGVRLSRQELFIIMVFEIQAALYSLTWMMMLRQAYVRNTPLGLSFGLGPYTPDWFAPSSTSAALAYRTFFSSEWIMPVAILAVSLTLSALASIALGFFTFRMMVVDEKLPFPIHQALGEAVTTIAERGKKLNILMVCIVVGIAYGFLLYFLPFATGVYVIPIPWADFNYYMQFLLPGASFGIATDILAFSGGFIIPLQVIVWIFVGAVAVHVVGNYVLVNQGIWTTWAPQTDIFFAYRESLVRFWLFPVIATTVTVAVLPIVTNPKMFTGMFRRKASDRQGGVGSGQSIPRGKWLLAMYLSGTLGSTLLQWYLVPDLPVLYFVLVNVGFTFLWTVVSARAMGLTGQGISIPYLYQGVLTASGSSNPAIWFMPMPTFSEYWSPISFFPRGAGWLGSMRLADLCGVRLTELVKMTVVFSVAGIVMGLVYTQLFWWIAEIPSSVFPWLQNQWPVDAVIRLWWASNAIKGELVMNWTPVIGLPAVVTAIYFATNFLHLPFSLIGLVIGFSSYVPGAVSLLIGGLAGRYVLGRFLGKEWWDQSKAVVVAGLTIGEGIIIVFSSALAMIGKALWVLPY